MTPQGVVVVVLMRRACLYQRTCTVHVATSCMLYTYSHMSDNFMVVVHCTHLIGLTKSKDILTAMLVMQSHAELIYTSLRRFGP